MLKIVFFAQLREQLATSELQLDVVPSNVGALRNLLAEKGQKWRDFLKTEHCLAAVNQVIADNTQPLQPHDEVAFFPPVTGG